MFFIVLFTLLTLMLQFCSVRGRSDVTRIINYQLVLILIIISIIISYRTGIGVKQSDILVYDDYMRCLTNSLNYQYCNSNIGASDYDVTLYFITKIVMGLGLSSAFVLFSCSILLSLSLFFLFRPLAFLTPFALFLSLIDSNYWELTANILRQSLALSFFLLFVAVTRNGKRSSIYFFLKVFFFLLSLGSHSMGLIYFLCYFISVFLSVRLAFFVLLVGLMLGGGVLPMLVDYFQGYSELTLLKKMKGYSVDGNESDFFSIIGKVNFFILLFIMYLSNNIKSDDFRSTLKFLLLLLSFGAVFVSTPIVYRVLNLFPFLMIFLLLFMVKEKVRFACFLLALYIFWNVSFDLLNYNQSMRFIMNLF